MGDRIELDRLTSKHWLYSIGLSQGVLLGLALVLMLIFHNYVSIFNFFGSFSSKNLLIYGLAIPILWSGISAIIDARLPKKWIHDGGVNKGLARTLPFPLVIIIMIVVAVAEEFLFRGVLQALLGWIPAALFFIVVHVRYLTKPILFIIMTALSLYLGLVMLKTGNLMIPALAHFVINILELGRAKYFYHKEI